MNGGGGPPKVQEYAKSEPVETSEKGNLKVSLFNDFRVVHGEKPDGGYFSGSPSLYGWVFYRDACKIVFGEAEYASVSEPLSGERKYWGRTNLADHKSAHHFFGVIHE